MFDLSSSVTTSFSLRKTLLNVKITCYTIHFGNDYVTLVCVGKYIYIYIFHARTNFVHLKLSEYIPKFCDIWVPT